LLRYRCGSLLQERFKLKEGRDLLAELRIARLVKPVNNRLALIGCKGRLPTRRVRRSSKGAAKSAACSSRLGVHQLLAARAAYKGLQFLRLQRRAPVRSGASEGGVNSIGHRIAHSVIF
jgi:hypothetical protein